jgi:hypothetical protein
MSTRERIEVLLDELTPDRLEVAERLLRGLTPENGVARLSLERRLRLARPILDKHEAGAPLTQEERLQLADLACGMSAGLGGSVEDFLREKHEETEREEARLSRRDTA